MPLPDKAMYDRDFYLQNVELSLKARNEMPWGKTVPEREFRHFVLPVRVNNENLDMSRQVFYDELKDRVKNLSMEDAILEINHWCHEKATYQPSDARTSSPLSTVSQAIGRCGEESTFTVAALRAMGIPARQVYTPRWAHTDDNHAWVEAWANGKWYFLGACEPEPILNLAWFNSPASRGMLMHTNVFGVYDGPEEAVAHSPYYTVINVTENYAPVAPVTVQVLNSDRTPAKDVVVKFCLYNYAEYYPLAQKQTDDNGNASLNTGKGDLVIWASDGKQFGLAKGNSTSPVTVVLDKDASYSGSMQFDLIPPPASASLPKPTEAQALENDKRKSYEDSIRHAYMATFANEATARELAGNLSLDPEKTVKVLTEARGNHKTITDFLTSVPAYQREKALSLLLAISEKDRRDVAPEVLYDHIATPETRKYEKLYVDYILNPRIENENLTPYKEYFRSMIPESERAAYSSNPDKWVELIKSRIKIQPNDNPKQLRMSPRSVWESGTADPLSAAICFVAGARSCGIPARIDAVTGKPQYALETSEWVDVKLDNAALPSVSPTGNIKASEILLSTVKEPKYYNHFSISKIDGGFPRQLEYDEGTTLEDFLNNHSTLEEGQYMLVTGQRLANGGVLAQTEFFTVKHGETTEIPFVFRHDDNAVQVIGSLNSENIYHDLETKADKSILSTTGRGYYVIGLIQPNHEPTSHALNDISALKSDFEKWGKKIVLLFKDENEASRFNKSTFKNLPENVIFGIDKDSVVASELAASLNLTEVEKPLFVIADTFNRVVYMNSGYTIGLGEALMSVINRLEE
ncbi:MAG: transglutaminase domain-containing protein [Muribaculaceae bacterium]|nr:transglutaminase domain-containing protein [Muribaculaceae bacterium]